VDRGEQDDWGQLDATAQAELVARREVSPVELVEAAIRRIERIDPLLGAVPVRFLEDALRSATTIHPGVPFAGVPFLMKDVGARQAGQPYYAGNRALRDADYRADADTPLGARFRELGLVTLGNSNSPEFGLQSNTWPLAHGPTRNPWDPTRAAGGSSGGACAAVAAGLVPVAHASDGAGSIRIPSAWCGLIGLKPTRDRVVSRYLGQGSPEVEFVVARSLRDTATLLDELRPPRERGAEPSRFARSIQKAPRRLRVGFCLRSPDGSNVDPSCAAAVERTAAAMAKAGHIVAEEAPTALFNYAERAFVGMFLGSPGYWACIEDLERRLGRPVAASDVEPFLWELATSSKAMVAEADPDAVGRAVEWTRAWERSLLAWFEDHELFVTPTVYEPAPLLESMNPARLRPLELLETMVPHMAFTEPWNATGQPAISLPLGWSAHGRPVGVQLVARLGAEDDLLAASAQLLDVLGEPERRPRVHV